MQGRSGSDKPQWDERQTEARLAALRATNRHRAVSPNPPQRPPGTRRLDTPPEMTRAPRPQRETRKKSRRGMFIIGTLFIVAAVFACVVGILFANGITQSSGPTATVASFFDALSSQDYKKTYQNLGPSITLRLSENNFTKQATELDQLYGKVVDYKEDADSAHSENGKQSFTFTIKREKYDKEYKIRLTLQEVQNEGWRIIDYGSTLGPTR